MYFLCDRIECERTIIHVEILVLRKRRIISEDIAERIDELRERIVQHSIIEGSDIRNLLSVVEVEPFRCWSEHHMVLVFEIDRNDPDEVEVLQLFYCCLTDGFDDIGRNQFWIQHSDAIDFLNILSFQDGFEIIFENLFAHAGFHELDEEIRFRAFPLRTIKVLFVKCDL